MTLARENMGLTAELVRKYPKQCRIYSWEGCTRVGECAVNLSRKVSEGVITPDQALAVAEVEARFLADCPGQERTEGTGGGIHCSSKEGGA